MVDSPAVAAFEEVLCAWAWWDCPRSGVALVDGVPNRFDCPFSEEIDEYSVEFRIWPVDAAQLEDELALWARWVEWRGRWDAGEAVGPFENQPGYAELTDRLEFLERPPANTRLAVPQWKLDPNRSFAGRVPTHFARWQLVAD